jgi:AraC-like DNA-binding protein
MEPGEPGVRMWRADVAGGALCMSGTTSGYAVDPAGESVLGLVLAGAMEVRRGRERYVFGSGDVCAWDPSAAHAGRPYGGAHWTARLIVLELPAVEQILTDPDGPDREICFPAPRIRDAGLARRFLALHEALRASPWALERETLLSEWLTDARGAPLPVEPARRVARRDPALRRACELLRDEPARNVGLAELAAAAGVSRHRLARLFRAAYGLPPHRFALAQRVRAARRLLERGLPPAAVAPATGFFDQSHMHRHFRRALGITPARYAELAAQSYKTTHADPA